MYRIEVAPGEETVFRTMEELAVGIRNGVVTPRSRIYHNASQKWLPIGLHPHYKKALELPAARPAHLPAKTQVPATPRSTPRVEPRIAEHHHEPGPVPSAKVPAPVTSPVLAMQKEVLRDLPVVAIPEPLPWSTARATPEPAEPPSPPAAPVLMAQAVQSQPTATVTYTPHSPAELVPTPAQEEPVEEAHARPTARRAQRAGGRPLLLVGVAAALVFAAHFALTATPSASAGSSDSTPPEEVMTEPAESETSAEKPSAQVPSAPAAATAPPRVTREPARVRMTPGPAFAGSVPAQPGTGGAAPRAKAPPPPAASLPDAPDTTAPSIAPAPVDLKLAVPDLADSLGPARTGDTMAMKKILRALNGSKR